MDDCSSWIVETLLERKVMVLDEVSRGRREIRGESG